MQTKERKDNGPNGGCTEFGCCRPEDFKKMFETKCDCFSGRSDVTDFSAMMKNMMGMCCEVKADNTKMDNESQNKPNIKEGSNKEQCDVPNCIGIL